MGDANFNTNPNPSPRSFTHEDAFSGLQLRFNPPPNERDLQLDMNEDDYYFENYYSGGGGVGGYGRRFSGKRWSTFLTACFDLGVSSFGLIMEGRGLIGLLVNGSGPFLLSVASASLILTFFWFIGSWKLLESSYMRKQTMERYQLAKFWRLATITLFLVFLFSTVLTMICIFSNCGISQEIMEFIHSSDFRSIFLVAVLVTCAQRLLAFFIVNKYIVEMKSELSIESFPLRVL